MEMENGSEVSEELKSERLERERERERKGFVWLIQFNNEFESIMMVDLES
jgi:hypothetical protein